MPVWRKEHEVARVIVQYIGMIITAVALTAFMGVLGRHPILYGWGGSVGMALPTSTCLILAGVGFFLVSRGEAAHGDGK